MTQSKVEVCWRQADQAEARKLSRYDCRAGADRSYENAWRHFEGRAGRIEADFETDSALTLGELFDRYIEDYAQHHCTTWADTQKNFRRYFDIWLSVPIDTITRNEVQQHVNLLGRTRGHHTANRSYDDLRAVYSWGTKYGYLSEANPCTNITRFKTRAREHFIRPDEFEKFLEHCAMRKSFLSGTMSISVYSRVPGRRACFRCDGIKSILILVSGTFQSRRIRNHELFR